MDAHFEDWTFLTVPSAGYSNNNNSWDDSSSASSESTPRLRPTSRLPSSSSSNRRPRAQRRHSPEATYLLSLVHPTEPIKVPVPPSLQSKNSNNKLLSLSERTIVSQHQPEAWYDYNEFGILEDATSGNTTSSDSTATAPAPRELFNGRPSARFASRSTSSLLALRKDSSPPGLQTTYSSNGGPYGTPGTTPPRPSIIPKSPHNLPPPLALPSPVLLSRTRI